MLANGIVNSWAMSIRKRDPMLMTFFYSEDAILLATFSNFLQGKDQILDYFIHFLNKEDLKCTITKDVSQLDYDKDTTIHNGLYFFSFREFGQMKVVKARYTFVINENQILSHHSSLIPE
tara:strand:+ start:240 stop:599 length:360 start_codon:yes stop_codon:yes gene_type:complete